jgi:hypothetical protein
MAERTAGLLVRISSFVRGRNRSRKGWAAQAEAIGKSMGQWAFDPSCDIGLPE